MSVKFLNDLNLMCRKCFIAFTPLTIAGAIVKPYTYVCNYFYGWFRVPCSAFFFDLVSPFLVHFNFRYGDQ